MNRGLIAAGGRCSRPTDPHDEPVSGTPASGLARAGVAVTDAPDSTCDSFRSALAFQLRRNTRGGFAQLTTGPATCNTVHFTSVAISVVSPPIFSTT
jgi:hypothetical protein